MEEPEPTSRMERFEDYVKRVRTQAGLTQLELSRRIGCSSSYIGRMETGSSLPSEARCLRIAEATGSDPRTILTLRQYWKAGPEGRRLLMDEGPALSPATYRDELLEKLDLGGRRKAIEGELILADVRVDQQLGLRT